RGLGAMMAFELSIDGDINKPDTELCKKVLQRCYEKGLIVISAGIYSNIIRNLAPLVISDEQLNNGLNIIEESLNELTQK
ncbi:MAG: aminotransferase class III-fold pyridoxal phosphate-dependent enzyme, partial [Chitinophagales bacterium]